MARVLVTGSTQGVGRITVDQLRQLGHQPVLHLRDASRRAAVADLAAAGVPVLVGDLADLDQVRALAAEARSLELDAVVHNAGVIDGPSLLPVNVVAPYLLTALLPASRLVYLSSSMHRGGRVRPAQLADVDWNGRGSRASYSDSKLLVTALALAVARARPAASVQAVDPGWVPTRMGGSGAPDDLQDSARTQVWLVTTDDAEARGTGGYWHHMARQEPAAAAQDATLQQALLAALQRHTGTALR